MKKQILTSILIIGVIAGFMGVGTFSVFSDTEAIDVNDGIQAGTLDLTIDSENPCTKHFSISELEPGDTVYSDVWALKNIGDVDGDLTVTIKNLVCNENGLAEPEIAAGDSVDTQMDPDGFSQETGYGELWDQVLFSIVIDSGDGVAGGPTGWQDSSYGLYPDESGTYHIPVDTPITMDWGSDDGILDPNEEMQVYLKVTFIDDQNAAYGWILDGVPNNAAMGDSITMDLEFDLIQN